MGKYLDFYKKCISLGRMPENKYSLVNGGLCSHFKSKKEFNMIIPRGWDELGPYDHGLEPSHGYWGYNGFESEIPSYGSDDCTNSFTPLRQNIVLLMAAMNNEL